jgi:DNA-directed RNA polymerase beta' subunit
MLDQGKDYRDVPGGTTGVKAGAANGRGAQQLHVSSMRSRWVGKTGRIRRECMGKRVNYCARSVVTCDSYIDALGTVRPSVGV